MVQGRAEEFLSGWLKTHPGRPRGRRVEVGLPLRRGAWRRRRQHARGEGPLARGVPAATATDARAARRTPGRLPRAPRSEEPHSTTAVPCCATRVGGRARRRAPPCCGRSKVEVGGRRCSPRPSTWSLLEDLGRASAQASRAAPPVLVREPVANGRLVPGSDDPAPAVASPWRTVSGSTPSRDRGSTCVGGADPDSAHDCRRRRRRAAGGRPAALLRRPRGRSPDNYCPAAPGADGAGSVRAPLRRHRTSRAGAPPAEGRPCERSA